MSLGCSILQSLKMREKETRDVIYLFSVESSWFLIHCSACRDHLESWVLSNNSWVLSACCGSPTNLVSVLSVSWCHGKQVDRTGPRVLSSIVRKPLPNLSVTPISLPSNPVKREHGLNDSEWVFADFWDPLSSVLILELLIFSEEGQGDQCDWTLLPLTSLQISNHKFIIKSISSGLMYAYLLSSACLFVTSNKTSES